MSNNNLIKSLKIMRIHNNETAINMAGKLGISPSFLSAIETGRKAPPIGFSEKLKNAYDLDQEEFQLLLQFEEEARENRPITISPDTVNGAAMRTIKIILSNQTSIDDDIAAKVKDLFDKVIMRSSESCNARKKYSSKVAVAA